MKFSRERLLREAVNTGFRPESLEKVIRLVGLLNEIFRHGDLRERLVLKGGTALNLFLFDVPRLSVDIDLNYIGSADLKGMEMERPALEAKLQAVFETDDFTVRRMPVEYAGGKWQLRYLGAQGQGGNLEVDLNFLHRIPLEPIRIMDSKLLGSFQAKSIPVLDLQDYPTTWMEASAVSSRVENVQNNDPELIEPMAGICPGLMTGKPLGKLDTGEIRALFGVAVGSDLPAKRNPRNLVVTGVFWRRVRDSNSR